MSISSFTCLSGPPNPRRPACKESQLAPEIQHTTPDDSDEEEEEAEDHDDETTGKHSLSGADAHAERILHQRSISLHRESAMNALMEDFAFLGDAVV